MTTGPYRETRASGVEWLADIPSHWAVKRLKFSVRDAKNGVWGDDPTGDGDTRCVRVADFDRPHLLVGIDKATYRSISAEDLRNRGISRGDLLLEKSGGGEKSPVGFVVRYELDEPAVCSNFVARVRLAPSMDSRFWTFVHHSNYQKLLTQRSIKQTSGIQNLDQQSYLDERVAFPPFSEQREIADFLDRETAQIDELIGKQNSLIELLGERRKAAITQAVTKGINANVIMTESDVEWIGLSPAHWSVVPVRQIMTESNLRNEGAINQDYLSLMANRGVMPYAEKGDVGNKKPEDLGKCKLVFVNDFVINSMNYQIGSYGVSRYQGVCSPVYIVMRHRQEQVELRFALRIFEIPLFQKYAQSFGNGILDHRRSISWDSLKNLKVPLPGFAEQAAILQYLDRATRQVDLLVERAVSTVALLQERRTALITAAVTGKIDVRGAS